MYRSTAFFRLEAAALLAEFVGPIFASGFMEKSVWIPLLGGLSCQVFAVLLSLLVPETRPPKTDEVFRDDTGCGENGDENDSSDAYTGSTIYARFQEIITFLMQDHNVALLVLTFFVASIGRRSLELLLQYVSKRYGWTLAQVCCS